MIVGQCFGNAYPEARALNDVAGTRSFRLHAVANFNWF